MKISELSNSIINPQTKAYEIDTSKTEEVSFADILKDSMSNVNQLSMDASKIEEQLVLGEIDNIHDVTIANTKAEIALELAVSVTNKVLSAYEEITRIQF